MSKIILSFIIFLSYSQLFADVRLDKVIHKYNLLVSADNFEAHGNTLYLKSKDSIFRCEIAYLMLANNLCPNCLENGLEYPLARKPSVRVNQIIKNSGNKDSLFYLEIIFALDTKDRAYIGISNIEKININKAADIKKIYNYFDIHSIDSVKVRSIKNYEILTNPYFINAFFREYSNSKNNKSAVKAVVGIPMNNFLYRGIETEINVAMFEGKASEIYLNVSNAEVKGVEGRYFVKALDNRLCNVTISTIVESDTIEVLTTNFRVRSIPNPVIHLSGTDFPSKKSKGEILYFGGLIATLDDFPYEIIFKVKKYNCSIYHNNKKYNFQIIGASFSKELRIMIAKLEPGDYLLFQNIIVESKETSERVLKNIRITIK